MRFPNSFSCFIIRVDAFSIFAHSFASLFRKLPSYSALGNVRLMLFRKFSAGQSLAYFFFCFLVKLAKKTTTGAVISEVSIIRMVLGNQLFFCYDRFFFGQSSADYFVLYIIPSVFSNSISKGLSVIPMTVAPPTMGFFLACNANIDFVGWGSMLINGKAISHLSCHHSYAGVRCPAPCISPFPCRPLPAQTLQAYPRWRTRPAAGRSPARSR